MDDFTRAVIMLAEGMADVVREKVGDPERARRELASIPEGDRRLHVAIRTGTALQAYALGKTIEEAVAEDGINEATRAAAFVLMALLQIEDQAEEHLGRPERFRDAEAELGEHWEDMVRWAGMKSLRAIAQTARMTQ